MRFLRTSKSGSFCWAVALAMLIAELRLRARRAKCQKAFFQAPAQDFWPSRASARIFTGLRHKSRRVRVLRRGAINFENALPLASGAESKINPRRHRVIRGN